MAMHMRSASLLLIMTVIQQTGCSPSTVLLHSPWKDGVIKYAVQKVVTNDTHTNEYINNDHGYIRHTILVGLSCCR